MANLALTGSTGLLGRNILFELIKDGIRSGKAHQIWLLGRPNGDLTLEGRVREMLREDGSSYLGIEKETLEKHLEDVLNNLHFIHMDENKSDLGISPQDIAHLQAISVDTFIHNAGYTNFRHDENYALKCIAINVDGVARILDLIGCMKIGKFFFIGSAYSSGKLYGYITPDTALNGEFANPYQRSKYLGEQLVREYATKQTDVAVHIFRPSTICGRLMEMSLGTTSKFDVFYGWAKAFVRMKAMLTGSWDRLYEEPISVELRITADPEAGLNIIPADFCAKLIVHAALSGLSDSYIHLANHQAISHTLYISHMLQWVKVNGAKIVSVEPQDKNESEAWYYGTLHPIYAPYIVHPPLDFDTQAMNKLEQSANVFCPPMDESNFDILMQYAVNKNFGLERR